MNRLQQTFVQKENHFIPFIMCGDPDMEVSESLIRLLEEEGASAIELGVPFSDPMADGPVIQAAGERALKNQVTLAKVLQLGKKMRKNGSEVPLILFTYANPVYRFGMEKLVDEAAAHGFDGLIVPDLPFEESEELRHLGKKRGLCVIPLVAPTSQDRVKEIVSEAQGFVYCVSSLGTTGMRDQFAGQTSHFLDTVRKFSPVPTAVGFGISNREHVRHFLNHTDGVVVGSALVKKIEEQSDLLKDLGRREDGLKNIRVFVRQLKSE